MCNFGSNTTTQTTTPNPQALAAYGNILNTAQGVAATPYTPYGGELVAPVNQQQYAGISNINDYAMSAQPGVAAASNLAFQNAMPISQSQIQNYENPYTQAVVQATANQFLNQNQQAQNALQGSEISQGAFGGNRNAIAAAQLANQQQLAQAPVIAGLESQGYTQGVNTALTEQGAGEAGAQNLGGLSVAGENAALTGANAQVGAGSLEQSTQQALDQALMQQFYQQEFAPEAMTGWEAGVAGGIGSQMGGTSTTTAPPPSIFSQLFGLGALGAGSLGATGAYGSSGWLAGLAPAAVAAVARGGVVPGYEDGGGVASGHHIIIVPHHMVRRYAPGGGVAPYFSNQYFSSPYMGAAQIPHGPGAPRPPQPPNTTQNLQNQASQVGQLSKLIGAGVQATPMGVAAADTRQDAAQDAAGDWRGGGVRRRGGVVPGFDDGGGTDDDPSLDPLFRLGYTDQSPGLVPTTSDAAFAGPSSPPPPVGVAAASIGDVAPPDARPSIDAPTPDAGFGGPGGVASPSPSNGFEDVPMPRPRPAAADRPPDPYADIEDRNGIPRGTLAPMAQIESGGNPRAYNEISGAKGAFQFISSTGKDYGLVGNGFDKRNDPIASAEAAGRLAADNAKALRNAGLPVTPSTIYLAHQQGADGAIRLLTNPDKPAGSLVPPRNIALNGGNPNAPAGNFTSMWSDRVANGPATGGPSGVAGTRYAMRGDTMSDASPSGLGAAAAEAPRPGHAATGVAPAGIDLSGNSKLWPALMAMGARTMASHSPFPLVGIGEGAEAGVTTYDQQRREEQATALKKRQLDIESNRLDAELKRHQDDLKERTSYHTGELDIRRKSEESLSDWRHRQDMVPTQTETMDGHPIWGDKYGSGRRIDSVTGKPLEDGVPVRPVTKGATVGAVEHLADSLQEDSKRRHAADPSVPELTREQAVDLAHKAPNEQRERLAQNAWKNALGDTNIKRGDEKQTLEYWRNFYGLPPSAPPAATPQPGNAPAPGVPTSQAAPPQRAIDALKADPSRAAEFDRKYGNGAAARVLGSG